jgi:predicted metal-binding membrane protein
VHGPPDLGRRRAPTVPVISVATAAAVALLAIDSSRFSAALHHDGGSGSRSLLASTMALYLAGWALMMLAMMLPTAVSLLAAVGRLAAQSSTARALQVAASAGFLGTWMAVGYAFRAGDLLVHAGVEAVGWIAARPQLVAAAVLAVAGGYQFTARKQRCLTACRAPTSFVYRHWHGTHPLADAARVGAAYGLSCIGCCWALMLVMFAVGMADVGWMIALGVLMAVEKNTAFGRRLTAPLGIVLLITAALVAIIGR